MTKHSKVKLSFRLHKQYYDMLCELCPLFENNLTTTLEYILLEFKDSPRHLNMLAKLNGLKDFLILQEELHKRNK